MEFDFEKVHWAGELAPDPVVAWTKRQPDPAAAAALLKANLKGLMAQIQVMPEGARVRDIRLGCAEDGRAYAKGRDSTGTEVSFALDNSARLVRWETSGLRRITLFEDGKVVDGMEAWPEELK